MDLYNKMILLCHLVMNWYILYNKSRSLLHFAFLHTVFQFIDVYFCFHMDLYNKMILLCHLVINWYILYNKSRSWEGGGGSRHKKLNIINQSKTQQYKNYLHNVPRDAHSLFCRRTPCLSNRHHWRFYKPLNGVSINGEFTHLLNDLQNKVKNI